MPYSFRVPNEKMPKGKGSIAESFSLHKIGKAYCFSEVVGDALVNHLIVTIIHGKAKSTIIGAYGKREQGAAPIQYPHASFCVHVRALYTKYASGRVNITDKNIK